MKLIVKNNSLDSYSYADTLVAIPPSSSTEISSFVWFALYSDINFIKDVKLSNLVINDGDRDYQGQEAVNYLIYINDSNNYNNRDTDGAIITRNKAAKKGWSFWAVPIEITTSTLGGTLFCQDVNGVVIPWVTCKIYDANNSEITTAGLLNANLNQCVKTVIDFEPNFNYEIIGGSLRTNGAVNSDVRLWIVAAPDIPANLGGSKEFASGINLKFLASDNSWDIDGRVTKAVFYDANLHTGKIRMIIKHPAGNQTNLMFVVQFYRQ